MRDPTVGLNPINVLINGGFDADATNAIGWTSDASVTVTISSGKLNLNASVADKGVYQAVTWLAPSTYYMLVAKVNASTGTARIYTENGLLNVDEQITCSTEKHWSSLVKSSAAGALTIHLQAHSTSVDVQYDDVTLHLGNVEFGYSANDLDKWRHNSDATKIDGADIYAGSIPTTALPNQDANTVLAGPATGAAASPTFRALVDADLPTHDVISAHDASGLTIGHVIRASGATAFGFAQLQHTDLGSVGANDHHSQAHDFVGADHTGGTTQGDARTSLGLGTIATQAANSVAITGGAIDGTTVGSTTPAAVKATTLANTGQHTHMTYSVRGVFVKGFSDSVATTVFSILNTDEAGDEDAGHWACFINALVTHGIGTGAGSAAAKAWSGCFARAKRSTGTGVTGAVSEVAESASGATASATRDIGDIVVTTTETSEYEIAVQFTVDLTGSGVSTGIVVADVTLVWYTFTTPPTLAAA